MSEIGWLMRVEQSLSATFKQDDGSTRPGVMWTIGMKQGNEIFHPTVRALFADDVTSKTRDDQMYQGRTVMRYLNDQMRQGWNPAQPRDHRIYIGNPTGCDKDSPDKASNRKPWWKVW
jgi:hypothetical protein